jgi:glucose/mannose transport system substrate-binding protein
MRKFTTLTTAAAAALVASMSVSSAQEVEVLHWWTSGGEAAALNVLKQDLEGKGIGWADMPVAGDCSARTRNSWQPANCRSDAGLRHSRLG